MNRHTFPVPDPSVLFYRREREGGQVEVAKVQSITDHGGNNWRATFLTPGHAPYTMDQYTSELDNWEAVYAITEADVVGIVERVAQRVVALLQEKGASPIEIISTGMEIVESATVEDAIILATTEERVSAKDKEDPLDIFLEATVPVYVCSECGKSYKYEKSYTKHMMIHDPSE